MAESTARFTEQWALIGKITPASYTSEQNSGRLNLANYHRAVVIIINGALGTDTTLDSDIEQADAASGGTLKAISGKSITQLTDVGGDDDKVVAVEIDCDELDVDGGFEYINVELTPAVSTAICGALVFGLPRYKPAIVTEYDEVVD